MKQFLFALGLLLAGTAAHAQVTLEHKYGFPLATSKLSTGELNYTAQTYDSDLPSTTFTVYRENHSVLRQLTAPTIPGYTFGGVSLISDKLFNQDNALEFMANYTKQTSSGSIYRLVVVSENGTQLMTADTVAYYDIAELVRGSSGIKMLLRTNRLNASGTTIGEYTKVFALGGSYLPTAGRAAVSPAEALPYPNPGRAQITLPYSVPRGQQATLEVLDMTGRVVKSYTVDSTFDHLLLNATELPAGTYTYRLLGASGSTAGHRFVVQ